MRPGPTLVVLDYGAVEEGDAVGQLAEGMTTVVKGVLTRSDELVLAGVERMGFVSETGDRELLKTLGHEYLKVLSGTKISDFSRLDR